MDSSTRKAAILLWKVMKTASKEMDNEQKKEKQTDSEFADDHSGKESAVMGQQQPTTLLLPLLRPRLVSIGSQDTEMVIAMAGRASSSSSIATPSVSPYSSPLIHPISPHPSPLSLSSSDRDPVVLRLTVCSDGSGSGSGKNLKSEGVRMTLPSIPMAAGSAEDETAINTQLPLAEETYPSSSSSPPVSVPNTTKLVGKKTRAAVSVKGILRKKFAWKNFPELENFLIQHRAEYLQYSSSLNYTAEQKRYNNTLTNGLLELAEQHGYVFDDFTFPMVRDRIRCYYKSYVQAARKKQRRHG